MKHRYIFILFNLLLPCLIHAQDAGKTDYTKYVDPFIGTQEDGNAFIGAAYPFAVVKLGPDCADLMPNSGYSHDGKIRGFSHLHISGSGGGPKYGNILVYPFAGDVQVTGYGSDRANEKPGVGKYSVELTDGNILAELTCTRHAGVHRYTFNKPGNCGILIDAGSFLGALSCCFENQVLVGSEIQLLSNTEMTGYDRLKGGWNNGDAFTVYFYALFDAPAESYGTWKSGVKHSGNKEEVDSGEPVGAWFAYNNKSKKKVQVRVGISFISEAKAKQNCLNEVTNLTFEQIVQNAREEWNKYLQRVTIETDDAVARTKFYTAMYHSLFQPSDRTGENPKWHNNVPYYDDFYCLWDTYRSDIPLIGLIAPERETDIVNCLVDIFENEGYMPDARSGNCTGRTQGGSNCDMVVADAMLKGLKGIDYNKAFEAMLKDAEIPPGGDERKDGRGGLTDYKSIGYVSTNFERAGSRTLEYSANDWAIALCAKKLGKETEYKKYRQRAANWENLWKPVTSEGATGFIYPRKANGDWDENYSQPTWQYYTVTSPSTVGLIPISQLPDTFLHVEKFNPLMAGSWPNFFYESRSWEYSLYVPQDVKRLIEKCGGRDAFVSRLDTFFTKEYYDITNEPGFLSPCLYIYAGRPDKTEVLVNYLLKKYYTEKPNGIPGNDDSGAMSSWYIFHNIGFYPNAGQDVYLITTPHFKKATIDVGNAHKLIVTAENVSDKNIYITSAELNGKKLDQAWFRYTDIQNGGTLKFTMSDKPTGWASSNLPPSRSDIE